MTAGTWKLSSLPVAALAMMSCTLNAIKMACTSARVTSRSAHGDGAHQEGVCEVSHARHGALRTDDVADDL